MNANEYYALLAAQEAAVEQRRKELVEAQVQPKPVDTSRRRIIGYNGYGQVKRNGQIFRTHSGR
jgi:hypothetical protein